MSFFNVEVKVLTASRTSTCIASLLGLSVSTLAKVIGTGMDDKSTLQIGHISIKTHSNKVSKVTVR